jgi:hypothetical protein
MDQVRYVKDKETLRKEIDEATTRSRSSILLSWIFLMGHVYLGVSLTSWKYHYDIQLLHNTQQFKAHTYDWDNFCQDAVVAQEHKFTVNCALAKEWMLTNIEVKSAGEATLHGLLKFDDTKDYAAWLCAFPVSLCGVFIYIYQVTWRTDWVNLQQLICVRDACEGMRMKVHKDSLREKTRVKNFFRSEVKQIQADRAALNALLV